jgi:TatD DNase family protein
MVQNKFWEEESQSLNSSVFRAGEFVWDELPSIDAHAHVHPSRSTKEVAKTGAVLASTLSLDEAELGIGRKEPLITWGVGCHPRLPKAQQAFDADRFGELAKRSAFVGEIGLDRGSRVPMELQLQTFRQALDIVGTLPRMVSIHSYQANDLLLEELRRRPIIIPVLHWWTGSADETSQAVALGCYFSVHSAVARQSKFRTRVPAERLLVESDHGYNDPPGAIPCRIEWVEYLVAQQIKVDREEVRRLAWRNLATIFRQTDTQRLLPKPLAAIVDAFNPKIVGDIG